jgi:hypothetical protein
MRRAGREPNEFEFGRKTVFAMADDQRIGWGFFARRIVGERVDGKRHYAVA